MPVNERKRGRPARAKSQLTRDAIIASARQLMQQNGKIPSIRQVSGALGVDAMAIYHYFANKAELLEAVTISLIDDIYEPQTEGEWQQELQQLSKSYLELLNSHPGLLETLLTMESFGPAQLFSERLSIAMGPLRLEPGAFTQAQDLLVDYIHGVALAMQCRPGVLTTACIEEPLKLIFEALETGSHAP